MFIFIDRFFIFLDRLFIFLDRFFINFGFRLGRFLMIVNFRFCFLRFVVISFRLLFDILCDLLLLFRVVIAREFNIIIVGIILDRLRIFLFKSLFFFCCFG